MVSQLRPDKPTAKRDQRPQVEVGDKQVLRELHHRMGVPGLIRVAHTGTTPVAAMSASTAAN